VRSLHRPCVCGGTIVELEECVQVRSLHRPCVGGGTIVELDECVNKSAPSTDPVSVEERLEGYMPGGRKLGLSWKSRLHLPIGRATTDTGSVEL
jgi:hypothetical protein